MGYREFSKETQLLAIEKLTFHQPGFDLILSAQRKAFPDADIRFRFIEDLTGQICVVIRGRDTDCSSDGSGTKVFLLGDSKRQPSEEQYRGQREILHVLLEESLFTSRP
jgi:hypothetical protein